MSPRTLADELSVGQQQMIEIGRALTRRARIIIMDEPTSSLSEAESDTLFKLIKMLKNDHVAIVYISHKLDEVMKISDRITVIRDGKNIITVNTAETNQEELITKMIGRSLENMYNKLAVIPGETVLEVKGLCRENAFGDISFGVKAGEIIGFFGLVGAGRSEIMRAIFGVDRYTNGEVLICGRKLKAGSPRASISSGIAFCTENRKKEGLMLRLSVLTNMTLVKLKDLSCAGILKRRSQRNITKKYIESISIKTPSVNQLVGHLSGGNQQKVVVAKWLMTDPKVLIVDEPTRGIDIGSKAEIYTLLNQLAARGVAIILVSSEIEEIMGISDKIITIYEGRKTAQFTMGDDLNKEEILAAALGGIKVK